MTAHTGAWTIDNAAWGGASPRLSVLIPFFRDDPTGLLAALDAEAQGLNGAVEIVVLDDGSGDEALAARTGETVAAMAAPARFVRLSANEGRSKGRNRLMTNGRARHLLFLDSDMLPDGPAFLADYLALIAAEDPAVAFGGFTLDRTPLDPARGLHRALSLRGDCRPAAVRALEPAKSLCTSNLLVRREVFDLEAFDEGFKGWGWEDVEWAIRVGRRFDVRHVDNPASHLGLDTDQALLRKYDQSPANFGRMAELHPDVTREFPVYRAARKLRALPGRAVWKPLLRRLALAAAAPMTVRVAATKLYRAALYAEVV
ncbi:MAG: glycosyl transferase [Caulobacterales bacterium 32-69-10]|nr:MAG: glycosyl transferase [Caulobacterales bacterium 32-69-10]